MILAAHQPLYLPWLGFFAKAAQADAFVLMDDLQYEAQNYQNRNRIKVNNGVSWLTVPVKKDGQSTPIHQKRIFNGGSPKEHWQRKSWLTLEKNYARTPGWPLYADALKDVYTRPWERLVDLNVHLISLMLRWFGLERPVLLASSLDLRGKKTERILDLCRKLRATQYLSGSGGSRGYLDEALLASAGVQVAWQDYPHPEYPQRYAELGFVSHLSALDALFNCGAAAADLISRPAAGLRASGDDR